MEASAPPGASAELVNAFSLPANAFPSAPRLDAPVL